MPIFDAVRPIQPTKNKNRSPGFIPHRPRKHRKWKWLLLIIILLASIFWASTHLLSKANQIFTGKGNIFSRVGGLLISQDKQLIGESQGLINVLLMGVGGSGHDGAYLTDTMIVASINTRTNEVILTSIPRDFTLIMPKLGYKKINAAYALTYKDGPDAAGQAAINVAQQVTGFMVPYYAVIDFRGFVKAVDDVGGVNVVVDHAFTDSEFPNDYPYDTKGYLAPVTFTKGAQHMDGRTALIFARSRHSNNADEGSDFARSERQKKILVALEAKILALKLNNLTTINNLLSDFTDNFRTNLEPFELKRLTSLAQKINSNDIYSLSLEPQDDLICSALVDPQTGQRVVEPPTIPAPTSTPPPSPTPNASKSQKTPNNKTSTTNVMDAAPAQTEVTRMYVIQPCEGKTLADIHNFLINSPLLAKLKKESAVVEIQSSTGKTVSPSLFKKLSDTNIIVQYVPFRGKVAYTQTIIYDNSNGFKPNTLNYIKNNFDYAISDVNYPSTKADFVIIVGKDSL